MDLSRKSGALSEKINPVTKMFPEQVCHQVVVPGPQRGRDNPRLPGQVAAGLPVPQDWGCDPPHSRVLPQHEMG